MKRYLDIRLGVLLFASLMLCHCKDSQEPEYLFRASLLVNENHTWYKGFVYFQEILEERSDGRIKVEVYPSEQLAKELEAIRLIQAEVIEMTITGSTLNNWMDVAVFCELPFLLKDTSEMHRLIQGPLGQRIEREMIEICGLRPLGIPSKRSPASDFQSPDSSSR